ncbi:MAG: hypothetical protein ACRDBY_13025 [Cetobacterium sp.]
MKNYTLKEIKSHYLVKSIDKRRDKLQTYKVEFRDGEVIEKVYLTDINQHLYLKEETLTRAKRQTTVKSREIQVNDVLNHLHNLGVNFISSENIDKIKEYIGDSKQDKPSGAKEEE